ncbi:MAG: hypothetical protein GY930_17160 [bacterium]|nr:hypothetical protein [bacterium]
MAKFNPAGDSRPSSTPARLAIFLCMAWLLMGALLKLLKGNPTDLPPTILGLSPLSAYDTFRGAIAIELCIVAVALIWPRLGWMCLTAIYVVFLGLLSQLIQAGATHCGCDGGYLNLTPWMMLAIDGTLLALMLISQPWKRLPKTGKPVLRAITLAPIFALAFFLPWTLFIEVIIPPREVDANGTSTVVGTGTEIDTRGHYMFDIASWEGQLIYDIDLATLTNPADSIMDLPLPVHVVLYRKSCDHCQEHITELATSPQGDTLIALVRIPEIDDADANDVIELKPEGHFPIELVILERGYGCPTPSSFDVDEVGTIHNVQEIKHD